MMRSDSPAISTSSAPLAAISAAVPRSGSTATSPAGTRMISGEHAQRAEVRRQRPIAQVPGREHRHGELHDLRGLELEQPEVQPALRALADDARNGDREQQYDADAVQPWRQPAQEIRIGMRQDQHRGGAERQAQQRTQDRIHALSGGAVENDETVGRQQPESGQQRAVEIQCRQQLRRREQRTTRTRVAGFLDHRHQSSARASGTVISSGFAVFWRSR